VSVKAVVGCTEHTGVVVLSEKGMHHLMVILAAAVDVSRTHGWPLHHTDCKELYTFFKAIRDECNDGPVTKEEVIDIIRGFDWSDLEEESP
jgi:hypothetical protein